MALGVILSEVSNANEVDMASGLRTASRKRSRYRFRVREALLSSAMFTGGRGAAFVVAAQLPLPLAPSHIRAILVAETAALRGARLNRGTR